MLNNVTATLALRNFDEKYVVVVDLRVGIANWLMFFRDAAAMATCQ